MQDFMSLAKELNVQLLVPMAAMIWLFLKPIKAQMIEIKSEIKSLNDRVSSIDSRLSRVEGALWGGHVHEVKKPKEG